MANTSSVRLRLDVDQGHLFFAKDLVPVAESDLAGFIKAQKGGLPEIAKLVDENAAWYMAGSLDLSDELRQGLKTFTQEYMKIVSSALASQTGTAEDEQAEMVQTWDRFTAVFGPFSDRWIDCLRGDVAASFSLPAGEPFRFTEAFGLVDAEECGTLVNELADEFAKAIGDNAELAQSITLAEGPEIGGGESLVMTVDIVKRLDEVGPAGEEDAEAIITSMYGESFSGAVVAAGDVMLAAGGPDAPGDLAGLAAALKAPGKAPSFAPLEIRPGMMFAMNIGALMSWMQNAVPEGEVEFVDVAERLSGESGRIPMAVTFSSGMATFDIAVSLETIGTVAAIVQEQEAQRAPAAEDQAESAED